MKNAKSHSRAEEVDAALRSPRELLFRVSCSWVAAPFGQAIGDWEQLGAFAVFLITRRGK